MSLVLPEPEGTITVTPSALAGLVIQAAEAVDGVEVRRGRRRLDIDVALGEARVRLELSARYGLVLPEGGARCSGTGGGRACHDVRGPHRKCRRLRGGGRMSGRRASRRTALFLLYQWDITGQPLASLYEGEVDPFARETAEAVVAEAADYDRRITEAAESWTADRLGAIERNILRIALYELDGEEVPNEVAIDEAVNLAKRYATDDAARLVNGILGRIVREQVR
jgi:N utilization substance protein B